MVSVNIDPRVQVAMSDGVHLGLTTYILDGAEERPSPVVLEVQHDRKDDYGMFRTHKLFLALARTGIVGARLDLRGTGSSGGVAHGVHAARGRSDVIEVIDWISDQSWASGRVGMVGEALGAVIALETAATESTLAAICAIHPWHDRFSTGRLYEGGALLGLEQVHEPIAALSLNALPPDPDIVGDRWLEMWMRRLDAADGWLPTWLAHQHRDEYWQGSDPITLANEIATPVLLVGSWLDPRVDGVLELARTIRGHTETIIGPGSVEVDGPLDSNYEVDLTTPILRWFSRWFQESDGPPEPDARVSVYSQPTIDAPGGSWKALHGWPPANGKTRRFHLRGGTLHPQPADSEDTQTWDGPWTSGRAVGDGDELDGEPPALVFESAPLDDDLEIVGTPEVTIRLRAEPGARLVVTVMSLDSDGVTFPLTRGVLNLAHRIDDASPSNVPDHDFDVSLALQSTAAWIPAGHSIRMTVSGSEFPFLWPPPRAAGLVVHLVGSHLDLPVVGASAPAAFEGFIERDASDADRSGVSVANEDGRVRVERWLKDETALPDRNDLMRRWSQVAWISGSDAEPESTVAGSVVEAELARPGWSAKIVTSAGMTSDADAFHLDLALNAFSNGVEIWSRRWVESTPREWT